MFPLRPISSCCIWSTENVFIFAVIVVCSLTLFLGHSELRSLLIPARSLSARPVFCFFTGQASSEQAGSATYPHERPVGCPKDQRLALISSELGVLIRALP